MWTVLKAKAESLELKCPSKVRYCHSSPYNEDYDMNFRCGG